MLVQVGRYVERSISFMVLEIFYKKIFWEISTFLNFPITTRFDFFLFPFLLWNFPKTAVLLSKRRALRIIYYFKPKQTCSVS